MANPQQVRERRWLFCHDQSVRHALLPSLTFVVRRAIDLEHLLVDSRLQIAKLASESAHVLAFGVHEALELVSEAWVELAQLGFKVVLGLLMLEAFTDIR